MPYRVKIVQPNIPEPFYWPGLGDDPMMMNRQEAERVVEDCHRLDSSLARWARERGEEARVGQYEVEWVKREGR
jgi:hypothetical protein